MANHVNTYVHFERLNEAGVAKLNELYSLIRDDGDTAWFSDIWGLDPEVTDRYDWNIDNVGSKWCYFEDRGDDFVHLTSAWSPPEQGIRWLVDQLAEVDPDVLAYVTYEDEMPNFFGCYLIDKGGEIGSCEWNEEDINEMMKDAHPSLRELDEEEQSEVYMGIWYDNIWELVSEKQYETYQQFKEMLN